LDTHNGFGGVSSSFVVYKAHPFQSLIINKSCHAQISPRIVAALIATESGFNRNAVRYEDRVHDYSVGLMQIRMGTAKMLGYKGSLHKLKLPWVNIYYGTRYLKKCLVRYPNHWDGIVAYNQGRPLWDDERNRYILPNGRPQHYAKIVQSKLVKITSPLN
jgi:Soluble lytic murein transglycosylase and related regulatory proteins (some contain LysM/invasin domains)